MQESDPPATQMEIRENSPIPEQLSWNGQKRKILNTSYSGS